MLGENRIYIHDTIENCGFDRLPFMLLYHCNFGYPLISEHTHFIGPSAAVKAKSEKSQQCTDSYSVFHEPTHGYIQQIFDLDLQANFSGQTYACLYNENLGYNGLGAYLRLNKNEFAHFLEWKRLGESEYAVSLGPCNYCPEETVGYSDCKKSSLIESAKTKEFDLELGFVEGAKDLEKLQLMY
jgi:hypothetical protein